MPVTENDFERLETKVDGIITGITELRVSLENRITRLEVKAGLWGVIGGAIVTAVSAFVQYKR